jgi:hypothetical protein
MWYYCFATRDHLQDLLQGKWAVWMPYLRSSGSSSLLGCPEDTGRTWRKPLAGDFHPYVYPLCRLPGQPCMLAQVSQCCRMRQLSQAATIEWCCTSKSAQLDSDHPLAVLSSHCWMMSHSHGRWQSDPGQIAISWLAWPVTVEWSCTKAFIQVRSGQTGSWSTRFVAK